MRVQLHVRDLTLKCCPCVPCHFPAALCEDHLVVCMGLCAHACIHSIRVLVPVPLCIEHVESIMAFVLLQLFYQVRYLGRLFIISEARVFISFQTAGVQVIKQVSLKLGEICGKQTL